MFQHQYLCDLPQYIKITKQNVNAVLGNLPEVHFSGQLGSTALL